MMLAEALLIHVGSVVLLVQLASHSQFIPEYESASRLLGGGRLS